MPAKVVFYSNYFSPYRDALWRPLSMVLPLEVRLAANGDAGRGWETGHQSDVPYELQFCDLRATNWPMRDFWLPNKKWLDLTDVDSVIIGGWEVPAYWSVFAKAKRSGIRTVGFYESTPETQSFTNGPIAKLRAKYFLNLDAVVSSGAGATQALINMGVKSKNIFQGFNVVDHAWWNTNANDLRIQPSMEVGHSYLYVGRLIERKGIADLISAFSKCFQQNDSLRIVGKGNLHSELQALINSLGIQENVKLIGAKSGSDLCVEYSRAQTLVLASHKEVWGLVINEALASGLHVVVAENCGVVRDVRSMVGVFVFEESLENRITAMAQQMELSRNAWSGWIRNPEILDKDPYDFALLFEDALSQKNSS